MPETRPSKEFQVNSQGRKNNYKDNASELASSHPKRGALSLFGSYLGIQLDICVCITCVLAISAAIVFTSSSVEPGRFEFGSSDTARKCQTPRVPFDQLAEPEEQPKIRAHKNC